AVLRLANARAGGNQRIREVPSDSHDVVGAQAFAHHFRFDRIGTAFRQALVVRHGADRVGVTGDHDANHAAGPCRLDRLLDHLEGFSRQVRLIEIEEDDEGPNRRWWRRWRRRRRRRRRRWRRRRRRRRGGGGWRGGRRGGGGRGGGGGGGRGGGGRGRRRPLQEPPDVQHDI